MEPSVVGVAEDQIRAWLNGPHEFQTDEIRGLDEIMRTLAGLAPEQFYAIATTFGMRYPPKSSMSLEKRRYLFRHKLTEKRNGGDNEPGREKDVA